MPSILLRCHSCRALNRVPSDKLTAHPICSVCKTKLEYPRSPVAGTKTNFDREVFDWPEYLLLEFWAKWCGYCRMVDPVLTDLSTWHAGRLKVVKVDVDAEPEIAKRFLVKATPTLIMFKNGTQVSRIDGAPKEKIDLVRWVDQLIK